MQTNEELNITIDNRRGCRIGAAVLFFLSLLGICELVHIVKLDNAGRLVGGDGIIIFLEIYAFIAFSLGLFILLSTDYVTRYDETGIQTIKKGQVIRTVFWDDYEAAYFKYGYRGELITILSPRELSVAERKKMSLRFMHENHIYTIPFGNVGTKKRIGEIKEIIHFMEKKYCVSFEKSMSRSAHTFE